MFILNEHANIMNKMMDMIIEYGRQKLLEYAGLKAKCNSRNTTVNIGGIQLAIKVKPEITAGNKTLILNELQNLSKETNLPVLLFVNYIPSGIAKEYSLAGINYIDAAGNCYIKSGSLFVLIEGKKTNRLPKVKQARAFQEAGIKIVFHLLHHPQNIQLNYRDLANLAQVSIGSVSAVLQELCDLKFIVKTKDKKFMQNKLDLLNRWVVAYHDVLRPRLLSKRLSFTPKSSAWATLAISDSGSQWGGEPAGSLLTKQFTPSVFTIYTEAFWNTLAAPLALVPNEDGEIEIVNRFWKVDAIKAPTVPAILVYADLLVSNSDRNKEIAQLILDNELQYLQMH